MLPVTAEIAYNQSDFAYRKEPGVNQSSLKKILDSPAHYQAALKFRLIPTPAMEMGTAAHCLVLDGEEAFNGGDVKKPDDIKLTTKEGRTDAPAPVICCLRTAERSPGAFAVGSGSRTREG